MKGAVDAVSALATTVPADLKQHSDRIAMMPGAPICLR